MIINIIVLFIPIIFSKKNMPDFIKTIISAFAALSVITFILTEDITTPMRLIDPWT